MRFDCLQVTRRLSKLLGSQDDNQTGTQHPNDWGDTVHNITALGGGLTPGSPKQPMRYFCSVPVGKKQPRCHGMINKHDQQTCSTNMINKHVQQTCSGCSFVC